MVVWVQHSKISYSNLLYQEAKEEKSQDHINRCRKSIQQNPTLIHDKNHSELEIKGDFLYLIKTTYQKTTVNKILNNKKLKALSQISGKKQRCPFLPLLCNTVLEVIANAIRQERK